MKTHGTLIALALLSSAALAPRAALADDTIKVGLLATLEGPFTVLGQDSVRGAELAFKEANYTAGGKKIEIIKGSSDASPDSAVKAARKLVEQDGVAILIGPLSGDEGPRGQGLRQDPAERHLHQRHVGRAGHDAARSGAEFLPLHHRRRAMDGRARRLRLQRQALPDGGHGRGGLFVPLHAGVRLHGRLLQGRAAMCPRSSGCRSATRTSPR